MNSTTTLKISNHSLQVQLTRYTDSWRWLLATVSPNVRKN